MEKQKEFYRQHGHKMIGESEYHKMPRFSVQKRTFTCEKDGKKRQYDHMVTHSRRSAEVICTRVNEETHEIEICLIVQPRTPYIVSIDNESYARFFVEQPAGLAEKGEQLEETAKREVEEETGYTVDWIKPLIEPYVCRHVSYTDETSKMYVVGVGEKKGQKLDETEDIRIGWHPAYEVQRRLEEYLEGEREDFYGFDPPEMTILGLLRFFMKLFYGDFEKLNKYRIMRMN